MSVIIFNISGLAMILLLIAKKVEEKRRKPFFISNVISKGDTHIRGLYLRMVHFYSEGKEKTLLLLKRRIPLHSRNSLNKLFSFLREKRERYINEMRDSRLLKKPDGISEFFKNMSDIEKGNGEINDVYEDARQNDSVGLGSQNSEEEVK
ncbi:MAG: hypothetical protein A3B03_01080 [Candidatus Zambryskibacteria bacterium RIFCSPLOWO2_01_FULL_42_41]|nr:MAG: hypothetical protein A2829_01835 [Candidatus Zambryskibacteria bacterium RIFCSPHIGHO2_01_FULL_43_60]OHB04032.1 MAG: hypothetical protein A3B03_01080 [Candidatus Zambryskibacteria bacterium RIFCSPLOWO2_01_FULL_42_41]